MASENDITAGTSAQPSILGYRPTIEQARRIEAARAQLAVERDQVGRGISTQVLLSVLIDEALDARGIGLETSDGASAAAT